MDFLLDPFIITIPSSNGNRAENFIDGLYDWTSEIRRKNHKFWLSFPIVNALIQENQYPDLNNIPRYMEKGVFVDAITLFQALRKIMEFPSYLDETIPQIDHFYFELEDSVVLPSEVEERLSPTVADALKETLIELAIAKDVFDDKLANKILFGTSDIPEDEERILLETCVINIDNDDTKDLTSEWDIVTSIEQLDEIEGFMSFWEDTQRAISWMYRQVIIGESNPEPCPKVIAGEGFHDSIRSHGYHNKPTMLRKIFRITVLGLIGKIPRTTGKKESTHHALTDGKAGPQYIRESDQATAWRLYIQEKYPGWRVHYWQKKDKSVELIKFSSHDDKNFF